MIRSYSPLRIVSIRPRLSEPGEHGDGKCPGPNYGVSIRPRLSEPGEHKKPVYDDFRKRFQSAPGSVSRGNASEQEAPPELKVFQSAPGSVSRGNPRAQSWTGLTCRFNPPPAQ